MTRADFIVRIFGTGLMYTMGKKDPDVTVNNNSGYGMNVYYRGVMFNCPRWRTIEIQEGKQNS